MKSVGIRTAASTKICPRKHNLIDNNVELLWRHRYRRTPVNDVNGNRQYTEDRPANSTFDIRVESGDDRRRIDEPSSDYCCGRDARQKQSVFTDVIV